VFTWVFASTHALACMHVFAKKSFFSATVSMFRSCVNFLNAFRLIQVAKKCTQQLRVFCTLSCVCCQTQHDRMLGIANKHVAYLIVRVEQADLALHVIFVTLLMEPATELTFFQRLFVIYKHVHECVASCFWRSLYLQTKTCHSNTVPSKIMLKTKMRTK